MVDYVKNHKRLICLIAICIVMVGSWFFFSGRDDVSSIRHGSDRVRNLLEAAQSKQREETAAISNAETAVRDSKQTASRIETIEQSDAGIIDRCQSIIDRIRTGSKAENKNQDPAT